MSLAVFRSSVLPAFLSLLLSSFYIGHAQTRQYLDAPVVKSEIKLRWNSNTKAMEWAADGSTTFRGLGSSALFLTSTSLYVTYPMLNPLKTQANVSATAVDDPAYSTITKLIDSLTSVATTVAPAIPNKALAPGPPAAACSDAAADIHQLRTILYGDKTSAKTVSSAVQSWIAKIDTELTAGKTGPQAIQSAIDLINQSATDFGQNAADANQRWKIILNCATIAAKPPEDVYEAAALSDQDQRIQQIFALQSTTKQLSDLLTSDYLPATRWMGPNSTDYIVSAEIVPTFDKMQNVSAKVTSISIKVDATTSIISTVQQSAGSATFSVRRYSALTPEVGVGAVFGTIKQPTYGTGTNSSGQTIVAKKSGNSLSVNPTILVNFVCRCGTGLLVPMLQIGAATSKDLPAILLGGGFHLFGLGKGDVAVGGGLMLGWYKDLNKLQVGDVVTGTNDINNDLGYIGTPKPAAYAAIQYKF